MKRLANLLPTIDIRDRLLSHAESRPDKPALIFPDDGRIVTYAELARDVARMAARLSKAGIQQESRVAIYLPNSYQSVLTWYATNVLGGVECPLGFLLEPAAVIKQLELIDPDFVVADRAAWQAVSSGTNAEVLLINPNDDAITTLTGSAALDLKDYDPETLKDRDTVAIFATSGTTGIPKGVIIPRRYATETARTWIRLANATTDDVIFNPLSLWHGNTQFMCVLASLELGATGVVPQRFSAGRFWEQITKYEVTTVNYHASMVGIILKGKQTPCRKDHSLRIMVGGGCPGPTIEAFENATGIPVLELYGLTEFMLSLSNGITERKLGSCGRVTDNFDVVVVDDDDRAVPPGHQGQLLIRPHVAYGSFGGYWHNEKATVSATRNLWFHTGDIVRMDEDGYVFFLDRAGNYIRKSGENIAAAAIEAAAEQCSWVKSAAAVGVPGEFGDEDIKLVVVGLTDQYDLRQLVAVLEEQLPPYSVPRYIEIRDSLPLNSSLRVVKGSLRNVEGAAIVDTRPLRTATR